MNYHFSFHTPKQVNIGLVGPTQAGQTIMLISGAYSHTTLVIPFSIYITLQDDKGIRISASKQDNEFYYFILQVRYCIKKVSLISAKTLFMKGVGFKFFVHHSYLVISAGFSHFKGMKLPPTVKALVLNEKHTFLRLLCSDAQVLSEVTALVQQLRRPDSYKGKGVHVRGKKVILKEGKKQK